MSASVAQCLTFRFSGFNPYKEHTRLQSMSSVGSSQRDLRVFAVASTANEAWNYIPAAPIYLPEGPWKQIPGGVTAANGFKSAGMYGGLRAKGEKTDLVVVTCDVDVISAGAFTTNVVAAAPVVYCKKALDTSTTEHTRLQSMSSVGSSQRDLRVFAVVSTAINESWNYIPTAPIYLPEGPWKQVRNCRGRCKLHLLT